MAGPGSGEAPEVMVSVLGRIRQSRRLGPLQASGPRSEGQDGHQGSRVALLVGACLGARLRVLHPLVLSSRETQRRLR